MAPLKVGVAGTHSTGKSTLLQAIESALADRDIRVGVVADFASEARVAGFPILRDHTFASTLWIMTHGISKRLEAELHNEVVLVDRPALDAVGYLWAALEHRRETLPREQEDYLLSLAAHDASSYDLLYKTVLDSSIPLGADRDSDREFREAAGRQVDAVFGRLGLIPRAVVSGREFREGLVEEIVGLL